MDGISLGIMGLVLNIVGAIFGSGLAYGMLRGEIRRLNEHVEHARETADRAHARLDHLLITGRVGTRAADGEVM